VIVFSVLIVTHDREELLSKCLDSLKSTREDWELIIVVNGGQLSSELTQKVKSIAPNFSLIENQAQLPPGKARNLGLSETKGQWIFFLDDDAYLLPSYWEELFPLLSNPKIDVLGGPDVPPPHMNSFSLSLALSLSSPFCTGPTFGRHKPLGQRLRTADEEILSSCNLWVRKSALWDRPFPEDYLRGEETVFLTSLKQKGRGLFYHPKLKVAHFRRSKWSLLFKPTFYAGFYRSKSMRLKLHKKNELFWLPALFVLFHSLIFFDSLIFFYFARMYLSVILFMGLTLAMRVKKISLFPLIALIHYLVVFIYGLGFLTERIRWKK
jgi:glycosyltransferase involved in cell wall biosynthesis